MTRVRGYFSFHPQWPRQILLNIVLCIALRLLLLPNLLWPETNVLTANYNNSRTNSNLSETILKPSNVNPDTFGKIGSSRKRLIRPAVPHAANGGTDRGVAVSGGFNSVTSINCPAVKVHRSGFSN